MHNIITDLLFTAVQAYPPSCPTTSVGIQCKLQGCISDASTQTSPSSDPLATSSPRSFQPSCSESEASEFEEVLETSVTTYDESELS